MKYLKRFHESLDADPIQFETDPSKIAKILKEIAPLKHGQNGILWDRTKINSDGSVDVMGDIYIWGKNLTQLPIKFGVVSGTFALYGCVNLTTLVGCPEECDKFVVKGGEIRFLRTPESGPSTRYKNLKGCPQKVYAIEVDHTDITSLEGCPERVGGYISASFTLLTSLQGAPKYVGELGISHTPITSLEGCPDEIERLRGEGIEITSFDGIGGKCDHISITTKKKTLKDPRDLKNCNFKSIICSHEPFMELVESFDTSDHHMISDEPGERFDRLSRDEQSKCLQIFLDSLDYNYIRGDSKNPHINLFRFKEALDENDIKFNKKRLKNYQLRDEEGRVVYFNGHSIKSYPSIFKGDSH